MTSGQPKRKRGVVLTPTGRQKLQEAIAVWEEDNLGEKLTIEELSDRTKLDAGTVAKVLDCEEGVDRRTLERFFQAFGLVLSEKDYSRPTPSVDKRPVKETRIDWGEAVDASIFYGRTSELETLEKWIVSNRCRLVALLGMGGIGKTSLAAKLGERVQNEFDYVVWRSLREAPPLKEILTSLVQFLSNQQETEADLPESLGGQITKLLDYLRSHRCLVVLDNAESILQEGQAGVYREGYEGYGDLLRRVGESSHQSCLLITSREKPRELSAMEGEAFLVCSLQVQGVGDADGQKILEAKGLDLSESRDQGDELIHRCAGNPLALKLVATTIQDLFDGDIADFLNQGTIAFEGIRDLLDQHFNRLSDVEKTVMYWLAVNREPVSIQELQEDIVPPITKPRLLEALKGLIGRALIEKSSTKLAQQAVVMEYFTEIFIENICKEIIFEEIHLFNSHAVIKATAKDFIRETQKRLILKPIIQKLITHHHSETDLKNKLARILSIMRQNPIKLQGYAGGNILNILCQTLTSLRGCDFSNLSIWQAHLQDSELEDVNFSYSNLSKSIFLDAFGSILSIACSLDGEFLALGDANGRICLWKILDGRQSLTLDGHTSWVRAVAFSPDSKILASSSDDQTIKLWEVETGKCLQSFQENADTWITSVSFSPDGATLVSGGQDKAVKLWDLSTGKCFAILETDSHETIVAFSPDGTSVASGGSDCSIKLWDVETQKCLKTFSKHQSWVRTVAFSPNGTLIASGSDDHTIKLWNVVTGECISTLIGHTSQIMCIAFALNGKILASGSDDSKIKLWDIEKQQCFRTLDGHISRVRAIAFDPKSNTVISGSADQMVKFWDIETGSCFKTLRGYSNRIWSISFNSGGEILGTSGTERTIRLWNPKTGCCIRTLRGHDNRVRSIAFSPDSRYLVSGSDDHTIRMWDVDTGRCLRINKRSLPLMTVAYSPDGQFIASAGEDYTINLWNTDIDKCLKVFQGHTSIIMSVTFSSDAQIIASGSCDHTVKLWDISTTQCLKTLQGHTNIVMTVAISPNSKIIASGSNDKTIRLWNIDTAECLLTLEGHTSWILSVAFSPDGSVLVSGSDDQTVKFWDVRTGQCLNTIQSYGNGVIPIAFSPDGRTVATGSEDDAVNLLDVDTGQRLRVLRAVRPYEGMNIKGATGLTEAQKASLIALGAVES